MITIFEIPADFCTDFGPAYMNEYDVALYCRMTAARLPEEVIWEDDRLLVDDGVLDADGFEDESDVIRWYNMELEWGYITDAAWNEFCRATASDAAYFAAAKEHGLELPEGYNPGWDDGTHDERCADDDNDNDEEE